MGEQAVTNDTEKPDVQAGQKRKIGDETDGEHRPLGDAGDVAVDVELDENVKFEKLDEGKKKKKSKHKRRKITETKDLEVKSDATGVNADIHKHFERKLKSKLTDLEKSDYSLAAGSKVFCAEQEETISEFLERAEVSLVAPADSTAKINIVVISVSAVRCVDMKRLLVEKLDAKKDASPKFLKMFGKHFKLKDQVEFLGKDRKFDVAVAGVQRLLGVLETDSLALSQVNAILFDWNHRNIKFKRIIDETQQADLLCDFLLKKCSTNPDVKLLFF